jgi:hypothetical protein
MQNIWQLLDVSKYLMNKWTNENLNTKKLDNVSKFLCFIYLELQPSI